jgi:predicted  nucleic acid-binding Zn-ribbon protein
MKKEPLSSRPPLKSAIEKYNEEADAIRKEYFQSRKQALSTLQQRSKEIEENLERVDNESRLQIEALKQDYGTWLESAEKIKNHLLAELAKKFH